jgi:hypothetical protein
MSADLYLFGIHYHGQSGAASLAAALNAMADQVVTSLLFATQVSQEPTYNSITSNTSPTQLGPPPAGNWNGLVITPGRFQQQLTTQQVLLWQVPGQETLWAVSTPAHTALVGGAARPYIDLVTVRPAKGGGEMRLYIGALALYDSYSSPTLKQLAAAVKERTKVAINQSETHDC